MEDLHSKNHCQTLGLIMITTDREIKHHFQSPQVSLIPDCIVAIGIL